MFDALEIVAAMMRMRSVMFFLNIKQLQFTHSSLNCVQVNLLCNYRFLNLYIVFWENMAKNNKIN